MLLEIHVAIAGPGFDFLGGPFHRVMVCGSS